MARTNYKAPLKTREQVNYLEANKKVVFNEISKDDAEHLLYEHNYINVISPFKHRFARKTKKGKYFAIHKIGISMITPLNLQITILHILKSAKSIRSFFQKS